PHGRPGGVDGLPGRRLHRRPDVRAGARARHPVQRDGRQPGAAAGRAPAARSLRGLVPARLPAGRARRRGRVGVGARRSGTGRAGRGRPGRRFHRTVPVARGPGPMTDPVELRTDRLLLRDWRDDDLDPFADLNADPVVMEYFRAPLTREESDAFADRIRTHLHEDGWGLWAVEVLGGAPFIGFVGLARQTYGPDLIPAFEVGWRLSRASWGHGYAPEAARAAIGFAFDTLG